MPAAVDSMFYVNEVPWHGLGHRFLEPPTDIDAAIIAAGLDWEVGRKRLACVDIDPETEAEILGHKVDHFATYRKDTGDVLGVVGKVYRPLQNRTAFASFQPFLDSGEATLETAGSLFGGKRVWVLAKLNRDNAVIVGEDEIAKFILLSHGHDGSLAIHYGLTPVRVVCANTEAMARSSKGSTLLKIRHTAAAPKTLEEVTSIINVADARFEATVEQYRYLASKVINTADLERYVRIVAGVAETDLEKPRIELSTRMRNKVARIVELTETGHGNDLPKVRGTWWAAYNGYTQHLATEAGRNPESRLNQLWFGNAANENVGALETALEMAAA